MRKKYKDLQDESHIAAEPAITYVLPNNTPETKNTTREKIPSNTMSVDEYFDELISLVQKDYEGV